MFYKFTFVWKKSNAIYEELLQSEIIPEIQRESKEQLSLTELAQIVEAVDEVVKEYDQQIEASANVPQRKQLRSA